MTMKQENKAVFNPEGIQRILAEGGGEDLNDDERALLLAMIGTEQESGHTLNDEELAVLEKLSSQIEGYDVEELTRAVKHMVSSQPRESRKLKWPDLNLGRLLRRKK